MFEKLRRTAVLMLGIVMCCAVCGCSDHVASDSLPAQSVQSMPPAASSQTTQSADEEEIQVLKLTVGDTTFTATLADNSSVDALKELLQQGPLTLEMHDYAGMEKGADLGVKLPPNNQQMNTQPGDIILYQGRTFVIYYDTNSWSLTPLARIDDTDAETLREVLGPGDVTVTLSLEEKTK